MCDVPDPTDFAGDSDGFFEARKRLRGAFCVHPRRIACIDMKRLSGNWSDLPTVTGSVRLLPHSRHVLRWKQIEGAFPIFEDCGVEEHQRADPVRDLAG